MVPFFLGAKFVRLLSEPPSGRAIQGSGRYATANAPLLSLSRRKTTYSFSELHFLRFKMHSKPSSSESHCILRSFTFSFLPKQASEPIRLPSRVNRITNPFGKITWIYLYQVMRKNLNTNLVRSQLGNSSKSRNYSPAESSTAVLSGTNVTIAKSFSPFPSPAKVDFVYLAIEKSSLGGQFIYLEF